MARIRSIHPGAPIDEDVASMSWQARLTWAYLPCHADREGRLKDAPFTLKLAILPVDSVDMNAILDELQAKRHIIRYEVEGRRYIQIRNFARYQTPHVRETPSEIPPAPGQALPRQALAMPSPVKAVLSTPDLDLDPSPDVDPDRDTESSEPLRAHEPTEPALLEIPCIGTGPQRFAVVQSAVDAWSDAFPGVNVLGEIRKAIAWLNANPTQRKTYRGMERFLVSWFSRTQDRGATKANGATGPPKPLSPAAYCDWHQQRGSRGKPAHRPLLSCPECKTVAARNGTRRSEPQTIAELLESVKP